MRDTGRKMVYVLSARFPKVGRFTRQVSYFKLFVISLFRPAAALLGLLLAPLPPSWARNVVWLCDQVLFWRPHPNIPISLFWLVMSICGTTYITDMQQLRSIRELYGMEKQRRGPQFKDKDRWIIKILSAERGCWISGCCLLMWLFVHRYRSLQKLHFNSDEQRKSLDLQLEQQRREIDRLNAVIVQLKAAQASKPAEFRSEPTPVAARSKPASTQTSSTVKM